MSRLRNRIARRRAQPGEEPTGPGLAEPRLHGVAERGRARRRLRYLRRLRELQLRDLAGFVLDLYRFGEQRDRLVRQKLDRVIDTDKESHALEALLGEGQSGDARMYEIRLPGVGGTCPSCGDFHATAAHFCANCGINLAAAAAAIRAGQAPPDVDAGAGGGDESEGNEDVAREAPVAAPVPEPRGRGADLVDGGWPEADEGHADDEPVQLAAVRERQRRATP
jgi:hypothetical protein